MLHMGTLLALLVYFWRDWLRLIPAGLAIDPRPLVGGDPDRKMAWLLVVATIPAVLVGPLLNDTIEDAVREPAPVALMLCVGAAMLWLAERWGSKVREMDRSRSSARSAIGVAQVLALVPGISRSGVSISAGLFLGLNREAAARFSFLMATPVVAGAGVFGRRRKLVNGERSEARHPPDRHRLRRGGDLRADLAIRFMLEFLRRQPVNGFVVYRVALAAAVFVVLLSPHGA